MDNFTLVEFLNGTVKGSEAPFDTNGYLFQADSSSESPAMANFSVLSNGTLDDDNSTVLDGAEYEPQSELTVVDGVVLVLCVIIFLVSLYALYLFPSPKGERESFLTRWMWRYAVIRKPQNSQQGELGECSTKLSSPARRARKRKEVECPDFEEVASGKEGQKEHAEIIPQPQESLDAAAESETVKSPNTEAICAEP